MCVDICNGSATVNLKGVSPLFNNFSKNSKTPSPLPSPFKQCCFLPNRKFGLDMHKIQWGIALFSNNIHLRGESLKILFLELIIYYSEDSWNNTRLCWVGVWAPTCEVQDAVQAALFSNNNVLRGGKKDMLFMAFIINYINDEMTWYQFSNHHISKVLVTCIDLDATYWTKDLEIKVVRYDLSVGNCQVEGLYLNISKMHQGSVLS